MLRNLGQARGAMPSRLGKANCPVSKVLNATITVNATLE